MAIVDMDGCETGAVLHPNLTSAGNLEVSVGRDGVGLSYHRNSIGLSDQAQHTRTVVTGSDEIFWHLGYGTTWATTNVIVFYSGGTAHIAIDIDATGHLVARRGFGGTVLATSTPALPNAFGWHSLQGRCVISDAAGVVEVKVDGVTWISVTGADTKNAGTTTRVDRVDMYVYNSAPGSYDDWVLCDTTGSANNSWTGEVSIVGIRPGGPGADSALVGSDGNSVDNYLLVDEVPPSSVDYNGSTVSGARDLYDTTAVGKAGTVLAVQQMTYAAKSEAGAKSFKHVRRSATPTVDSSSAIALSTTYAVYPGAIQTTDADGAAWTVASVDSHQFGFEVA